MSDRIYVTEDATDSEYYDPSGVYGNPQRRAGWFLASSAEYWHGDKEVFDGANLADVNTRQQHRGQGLYRTKGGRWVLSTWSSWQGETSTYNYTSPEDAREWLIFNSYDDAVRKYFGEIPDEQGPAVRAADLTFAKWLRTAGWLIASDADLDKLYDQWQSGITY
jgi:predicted ATPase